MRRVKAESMKIKTVNLRNRTDFVKHSTDIEKYLCINIFVGTLVYITSAVN